MARIRSIKIGFFENEELAELDPSVRLLFAGLWTLADREGRLEDRPKRIKAQLFAYDTFDVACGLEQLIAAGFIERYSVGEVAVLHVVNWHKHQKPHPKEAASELPPPPGSAPTPIKVRPSREISRSSREKVRPSREKPPGHRTPDTGHRTMVNGGGNGVNGDGNGKPELRSRAPAREASGFQETNEQPRASPGETSDDPLRDLVAYQLEPISREFQDDQPSASVTRVLNVVHTLALETHHVANAIKEARHVTRNRMADHAHVPLDRPMAFFLKTMTSCAKERAARDHPPGLAV